MRGIHPAKVIFCLAGFLLLYSVTPAPGDDVDDFVGLVKELRGGTNVVDGKVVGLVTTTYGGSKKNERILTEFPANQRKNLTSLSLRGVAFTPVVVDALKPFSELQRIYLDCPGFREEHAVFFQSLTKLESVIITKGQVTDQGLKHFAKLTHLKSLRLSAVGVQGKRLELTGEGFKDLAHLKELIELDLSYTSVNDQGLLHIGKMLQLKSLDLSHTAVTSGGLSRLTALTQLELLSLSETRSDDKALPILRTFPALKTVGLRGTAFTKEAIQALQKDRPELTIRYDRRPELGDQK